MTMRSRENESHGIMSKETLFELAETIRARRSETAEKSYTKSLLDKGTKKCAEKFGEEAIETIIAAVSEDDDALKGEMADLLYHLMVLMESRNIALSDVLEVLDSRMGLSGHQEKAARSK